MELFATPSIKSLVLSSLNRARTSRFVSNLGCFAAWVKNGLFPKKCVVCRREGDFLCADHQTLPESIKIDPRDYFTYVDQVWSRSNFNDSKVQNLVYSLKFKQQKEVSNIIAEEIKASLPEQFRHLPIIPIPLHWRKQLQRGFNQSELIAQKLTNPCLSGLKRMKHTHSQAQLNKANRLDNIIDAFVYESANIPETVLLLDDVFTTGRTLDEAARILKKKGVKKVYAVTFAHGS